MKSNKRLKQSLNRFSNKKQNKEEIYSGELGIPQNGRKVVEVPNRAGYVYARLLTNKNELIQALNTSVAAIYGLPVQIRRVKNTYTIIGKEYTRYSNQGSGVGGGVIPLPRHGGQHSLNPDLNMGSDPTWVYSRQIMHMLAYPSGTTSMMLGFSPGFYQYNNQWVYPQVTGVPSFDSYVPTVTGAARMALYYLDGADNGLKISAGALFSGGITDPQLLAAYIPTPPASAIPLMAVKLRTGTTSLDWSNLYDARPWLQILPTGSAGGMVLNIQDEGVPLGTATTLNFMGSPVSVTVSGTVANIFITGSSGAAAASTGSSTYFRAGEPLPLLGITGAYWQVPDRVYATGSLGVFINGHALIIGTDYAEQYAQSGTYQYLQTPATGTYNYVHYGVPGGGGGGSSSPTYSPVTGSVVIWDDGVTKGSALQLNFGSNITATVSGSTAQIDVSSVAPISINGFLAQDEGVILGTGTTLNFVGGGVTASISGSVVDVNIPSGSASIWTQAINESGSSFSNWTGTAGTWLSSGTNIIQTSKAASYTSARFSDAQKLAPGYILEADVKMVSSGGGATRIVGLVIGYSGANNSPGSFVGLVLSGGTRRVNFQRLSSSTLLDVSFTFSDDVFYNFRAVSSGGLISAYVDGVLIGTAGSSPANSGDARYVGLISYGCEAQFKNIKGWNFIFP